MRLPPRYAFAHLDLERVIVVLAVVAVAVAVWRGAGEGTQRRGWEGPQKGTGEDGVEHAAQCPPTCARDHSEPARGARDFGLARQQKVPHGPLDLLAGGDLVLATPLPRHWALHAVVPDGRPVPPAIQKLESFSGELILKFRNTLEP